MKHFIFCTLLVTTFLMTAENSHAIFEARVTYGLLASKPDLAKVAVGGATDIPTATANYGVGADALFVIPIVGLGFGVRYENLGFKLSQGGLEFKTSTTRTALLVNYRLINTLLYLGPIFSYGLSHSNNMTVESTSLKADMTPDSSASYTAGIEVGAKLAGFMVGAEAGYQSFTWTGLTDKNSVITTKPDIDMSGSYVKATLGFGI
jgi:hypothetical protein